MLGGAKLGEGTVHEMNGQFAWKPAVSQCTLFPAVIDLPFAGLTLLLAAYALTHEKYCRNAAMALSMWHIAEIMVKDAGH